MVEAVVFDIGNVLIEWQPERHFDSLMAPARRQALFAEADLETMNAAIDLGAPFRETVYDWAERHPAWRAEIRRWHDDWLAMASPAIARSVQLMAALRKRGVAVFALSNFGTDTFTLACRHYPFLRGFDRVFLSGELRLAKPDPRIYAALQEAAGLRGDQLLFADDRAENIAAAAALGWKTHHFLHPEGWAARLVAERLLDPEEAA